MTKSEFGGTSPSFARSLRRDVPEFRALFVMALAVLIIAKVLKAAKEMNDEMELTI